MINKYVKKQIAVDAIQFKYDTERIKELREFCGDAIVDIWKERHPDAKGMMHIKTLEDGDNRVQHIATEGDWIIKGIEGEFYPCKNRIFEKTYEPLKIRPNSILLQSNLFGKDISVGFLYTSKVVKQIEENPKPHLDRVFRCLRYDFEKKFKQLISKNL